MFGYCGRMVRGMWKVTKKREVVNIRDKECTRKEVLVQYMTRCDQCLYAYNNVLITVILNIDYSNEY